MALLAINRMHHMILVDSVNDLSRTSVSHRGYLCSNGQRTWLRPRIASPFGPTWTSHFLDPPGHSNRRFAWVNCRQTHHSKLTSHQNSPFSYTHKGRLHPSWKTLPLYTEIYRISSHRALRIFCGLSRVLVSLHGRNHNPFLVQKY